MSDTIEIFRALKDNTKRMRAKYGVECPECKRARPRGNASILLPQQRCRIDRYRDPRPELTQQQYDEMYPRTTET